jgi:hypothetical protein
MSAPHSQLFPFSWLSAPPSAPSDVTTSPQYSNMRTKQELDRLREQAIALRRQGKSRRQITGILGPVSSTTLNDALRGEPPRWQAIS